MDSRYWLAIKPLQQGDSTPVEARLAMAKVKGSLKGLPSELIGSFFHLFLSAVIIGKNPVFEAAA